MWTSVPHTPARRTRISTSSSRIRGSATSFSLKPGDADSFTSAFTCTNSGEDEIAESEVKPAHCATLLEVITRSRITSFAARRPMQAFDHMLSLISIESAFPAFHAHLLHSHWRNEFQTFDVDSFQR